MQNKNLLRTTMILFLFARTWTVNSVVKLGFCNGKRKSSFVQVKKKKKKSLRVTSKMFERLKFLNYHRSHRSPSLPWVCWNVQVRWLSSLLHVSLNLKKPKSLKFWALKNSMISISFSFVTKFVQFTSELWTQPHHTNSFVSTVTISKSTISIFVQRVLAQSSDFNNLHFRKPWLLLLRMWN